MVLKTSNDVLTMDFTNFSKKDAKKKDLEQKVNTESLSVDIVTWCKKELLNTMGGWIITYSKKYFCHDGKDGSCFDKYCNLKRRNNARTLWKKDEETYG